MKFGMCNVSYVISKTVSHFFISFHSEFVWSYLNEGLKTLLCGLAVTFLLKTKFCDTILFIRTSLIPKFWALCGSLL